MAMKGLPHMGQWSNLYSTCRLVQSTDFVHGFFRADTVR